MKKLLALLLFPPLFFGCSGEEAEKRLAEAQVLRLGVMPSMDYLPLAVARREGRLDERIEIVRFYSANERDSALQSRSLDGTVTDLTGALLYRAGGYDLKITSRCDAPFYIVAGAGTGIASLEELKGRSIAVSRHTVIDFCVDMALLLAGLSPEDVKKVEINRIPLRFEMLRNGRVEATGLPDPLATMARAAGDHILADSGSMGFSVTGIVFSQQAIDSKADLIARLYQAYAYGVEYLKKHTIADVADILKAEMGFTDDILPHSRLTVYAPAAAPAPEDLGMSAAWLKRGGLIPQDFDPSLMVDPRFVRP
ncbi:MAG: ABC transporter substrate-binding protein [Deltaproteobacteria bacterium]|jgi:NitT/TauT family transport system substrate-binding protein|nr:ABC transporter substrate-binding protein [Deltaproteobacteria bacterium]